MFATSRDVSTDNGPSLSKALQPLVFLLNSDGWLLYRVVCRVQAFATLLLWNRQQTTVLVLGLSLDGQRNIRSVHPGEEVQLASCCLLRNSVKLIEEFVSTGTARVPSALPDAGRATPSSLVFTRFRRSLSAVALVFLHSGSFGGCSSIKCLVIPYISALRPKIPKTVL